MSWGRWWVESEIKESNWGGSGELERAGHEIASNIGTNATKFFTLVTKLWKLVAKLATRMFYHNHSKRYSELKL